jgi:putative transposase
MIVRKGFKFRVYPNGEQRGKLAVQFGHARFVYNYYLNLRNETYAETGKSPNYYGTANDLPRLKSDPKFVWLRDADSQVLQQSLRDLQTAFDNFFRMHEAGTLPRGNGKPRKDGKPFGFPRFKSRRDVQSIRYPQRFKLDKQRVYLPKVGWVRAVIHRPIEGEMKNCVV